MSDSPTFIDLFSGAGGLSLGLMQAGWKPLLAVDHWPDATATYRRNFDSHPVEETDIHVLKGRHLAQLLNAEPDWIVGGPPCQGFSTVGKRIRHDPRNRMVEEFARVVSEVRPRGILVENVLGLRDMRFVEHITALFREIGYRITPLILRAADYGVPQLRRRVFFVGHSGGELFLPPKRSHMPNAYVTVWDAIGDLPRLEAGGSAMHYDQPAFTAYQRDLREGSDQIQGHRASRHPEHLVKAISFIPDGGNRRDIPQQFQPSSGFHNSYSRLNSGAPAVAITQNMGKPSGTRCIHPFQHRGLTAREGARLQGFPDRFHVLGGITSQRLQVANAVPPILARTLGRALQSPRSWLSEVTMHAGDRSWLEQLALPLSAL